MEQSVTKNYVVDLCDYLKKDGTDRMIGDINLGGNRIHNFKEPLSSFNAVNKEYADSLFSRLNDRIDELCKQ